jgi:hypothetical protein
LLVVDSLEVGGAERQVVDLAVALRRKGYEVVVACSVAGDLSGVLREAGIPVRPLLRRLVKRSLSPAYARRLRGLLRGERFDLAHAHIYASAAAAAIAASPSQDSTERATGEPRRSGSSASSAPAPNSHARSSVTK